MEKVRLNETIEFLEDKKQIEMLFPQWLSKPGEIANKVAEDGDVDNMWTNF